MGKSKKESKEISLLKFKEQPLKLPKQKTSRSTTENTQVHAEEVPKKTFPLESIPLTSGHRENEGPQAAASYVQICTLNSAEKQKTF